MPYGDGKGPAGMGPMTGRGAGFCAGYAVPGYANPRFGRSFGSRGGGGRGWRHCFYATGLPGWVRGRWSGVAAPPSLTPEDQLEVLKREAEFHDRALAEIRRRIEELEKERAKQ